MERKAEGQEGREEVARGPENDSSGCLALAAKEGSSSSLGMSIRPQPC